MKMSDLLHSGLINPGENLIWDRRVEKVKHLAVVNSDGTITTADGKIHKTPSGAAKHLNGNKPVDGWLAWKIQKSGKSIGSLRS